MQFPPILIINLKRRTDRWTRISKQLDDADLPYERVDAIQQKNRWKSAFLSHKKAIQLSKERGDPWVLLLEDDCLFAKDWKERFTELLPLLWQRRSEWDVFSGGSYTVHTACKLQDTPPLYQFTGWSSHFMLIHEGTYDRILESKLTYSINDTYRRFYTMWCTYPNLAIQTGGYSNIQRKFNPQRTFTRIFGQAEHHLKGVMTRCGRKTSAMEQLHPRVRKTRKVQKRE
jgi:hypothetical protein